MLEKSKSVTNSPIQFNLTKCNNNNSTNSVEIAVDSNFWPPSPAVIDNLILKLKAKDGDTESNWEKIILNFKKELSDHHQLLVAKDEDVELKPPPPPSSIGGAGDGDEKKEIARPRFSVPLSRKEMEKDFEDMGERRLPRKPRKRPKAIQNHLDTIFPGLWLTEIHPDLYRVTEVKKR
uniref:uncharacterized protein LOC122578875 n=1 Tax=Erigeron canadensis TaxID=72917 RepID=UPI001CB90BEC|nr:uncharacterized protein LOC122578875 [Erigeron canadensis]XP_043606868.1 uncharacterized protein LOC122578875 [Erigeron canadensis]